jgi:hypothetical protein
MSQQARAFPIAPVLLALAASGCPSSGGPNPAMLWLATDMDELHVKLVESEPPPF